MSTRNPGCFTTGTGARDGLDLLSSREGLIAIHRCLARSLWSAGCEAGLRRPGFAIVIRAVFWDPAVSSLSR